MEVCVLLKNLYILLILLLTVTIVGATTATFRADEAGNMLEAFRSRQPIPYNMMWFMVWNITRGTAGGPGVVIPDGQHIDDATLIVDIGYVSGGPLYNNANISRLSDITIFPTRAWVNSIDGLFLNSSSSGYENSEEWNSSYTWNSTTLGTSSKINVTNVVMSAYNENIPNATIVGNDPHYGVTPSLVVDEPEAIWAGWGQEVDANIAFDLCPGAYGGHCPVLVITYSPLIPPPCDVHYPLPYNFESLLFESDTNYCFGI